MHFLPLLILANTVAGSSLFGGLSRLISSALMSNKERPVKYEDTQPRLEIRLSPPRHPMPEVTGKIQVLDRARRMVQERQTTKLLKSFGEELKRSRKLIIALIRKALEPFDDPVVIPKRASSFYQLPWSHIHKGKVWVSVEAAPPVDGSVLKRFESIEERNNKLEIEDFKSAIDDMHEVTRFSLQQLNETLTNTLRPVINTNPDRGSAYSSFLAFGAGNERCLELRAKFGENLVQCDSFINGTATPSVHQHQITAFADEHTYPTVESLVRDMLERREIDAQLFQARSLSLMARLAQEQSKIIAETLQAAVATIRVQYADVIRATNMTSEELRIYKHMNPPLRIPDVSLRIYGTR